MASDAGRGHRCSTLCSERRVGGPFLRETDQIPATVPPSQGWNQSTVMSGGIAAYSLAGSKSLEEKQFGMRSYLFHAT